MHVDGCVRWKKRISNVQILNVHGTRIEPKKTLCKIACFRDLCCELQYSSKDFKATVRRVLVSPLERMQRELLSTGRNEHTFRYSLGLIRTANNIDP